MANVLCNGFLYQVTEREELDKLSPIIMLLVLAAEQ